MAYLERCCQKIYFPTEPVQPGTITLMHGVLFFLLKDFAGRKEDIMKEIDLSYIDLCERNFCRGLEVFETFTIPTLENILCLFMGVSTRKTYFFVVVTDIIILNAGGESSGRIETSAMLVLHVGRGDNVSYLRLSSRGCLAK